MSSNARRNFSSVRFESGQLTDATLSSLGLSLLFLELKKDHISAAPNIRRDVSPRCGGENYQVISVAPTAVTRRGEVYSSFEFAIAPRRGLHPIRIRCFSSHPS